MQQTTNRKEKQKEIRKKKELKALLAQIKAADKKKLDLKKSLENSRATSVNNTPIPSPQKKVEKRKGRKASPETKKDTR